MSMDLFVARAMITKASLVFRGPIDITESQVDIYWIIWVLITIFASGGHFNSGSCAAGIP